MNPQYQTEQRVNGEAAEQPVISQDEQLLNEVIANSERQVMLDLKRFEHKQRLANLFAASGCFADIKKDITQEQALAQAFVKIELGESMGFSPAESMQGVALISGTPSVSAQLRAARFQRAGYSWDIDWFDNPETGVCEGCRLWLYRYGKPLMKVVRDGKGNVVIGPDGKPAMEHVSVSFLKKDAEMLKTKIWEGSSGNRTSREASVIEKDNWKNTPRNMYFARAITNAQRWHAPGVLSGEVPSTEEVLDQIDPYEHEAPTGSYEAQQAVLREKLREAEEFRRQQQQTATPPADARGDSDHAPDTGKPESEPQTGSVSAQPAASKLQFGRRGK